MTWILWLGLSLGAQTGTVTGVVVAGNGLPVAGASVACGSAHATTGADGQFRLEAAGREIEVTAAGYVAAEVAVGASGLRIVLQPAPLAEAVTVTATERNQNTAAVPLHTAVMGRARLEASTPANVDSLLREFSDLGTFRVNSSMTANPTTQGVALLGTGSSGASRALVLLDGVPLNDFYGGWVDWLRAPEEDLASVSVVSGGASPLYGSEALSGVVGLETEAPSATHVDLRAAGGGMGTELADGAGVVAGTQLALALRGRGVGVEGYVPAAQPGLVDDRAGVAAQDWAPELRWLRSPTEMFTLASEYFAENRTNGTELQINSTRLRQLAARAVIERHGVWDASAFGQSEDFSATFSSVAADRNSERLTLEQQVPSRASGAGLDWSLAEGSANLVAGASYTDIAAVDNETVPPGVTAARQENGRQRLAGAFTELSWSPRHGWTWTGTLRDDHWSNYAAFQNTPTGLTAYPSRASGAVSPSLGTVWQARPWLTLHLSGYESFRAPTLNELYRPFRTGNVLTDANPLLEAERYRGAQAGAVLAPWAGLHLSATYFDGYVNNLVTSVTLSSTPALITRQRQNLGRVRPRGETLEAEFTLRPGLTLWTSITHLSAVVLTAPQPALVGLALAHVPDNNASARLLFSRRGWTFSTVERFGGSNFDDDQNTLPLPAFWTTDVFLSRALGRITPYLGVENLWNRRYAIELTPDADLNSPRAVTAGFRLQWGGGE